MSITDIQCRRAQPQDKQYKLTDGQGLSLLVHPNGSKYWVLRYMLVGKHKTKSLGSYPELSVKEAREAAQSYRQNLNESINEPEPEEVPSFFEVGENWFNQQKDTWSNKHIQNVAASLKELYFDFKDRPVNQINAPEILKIIKKIETRGSLEIAKRTLSRCGMVMKFAIAHGYRLDDPTHGLTNALKARKATNLASLPIKEIPQFLASVKAYPCSPQIHHAIMIIMLTGVRVSELLNARWDEFDIENKVWDIPAERMKNSLPHRVPLTNLVIDELLQLRRLHHQEVLFPHRLYANKTMTTESILQVIKRAGYAGRMTTHGFRSLFSTVINESNLFNPDAIERQLAHVPHNRIRAAYNRAAYWDERVKMMDWYSEQVKGWLYL